MKRAKTKSDQLFPNQRSDKILMYNNFFITNLLIHQRSEHSWLLLDWDLACLGWLCFLKRIVLGWAMYKLVLDRLFNISRHLYRSHLYLEFFCLRAQIGSRTILSKRAECKQRS